MKLLIILSLVAFSSAVSYTGYQVVRVHPVEPKDFAFLEELEDLPGVVEFWKPDTVKGLNVPIPVDIRIPRKNVNYVKSLITDARLTYEVKISDMQKLIDHQFDSPTRLNKAGDEFDYAEYHTYDEINQWTKDIATTYPDIVQRNILTTSFLGREIPYLVLGSSKAADSGNKILIDCGEHAREWIGPAVCQSFVGQMVEGYGNDQEKTDMMDTIQWVIVPLMNPDGYNYTWTDDRDWLKSRSNYENNLCVGVNVNTNFDIDYGGPSSSKESCDNLYKGPNVESEPEVAALANLMRNGDFNIFVTFHAYGQYILFPYFYSQQTADNHENMQFTAKKAAEAMFTKHEKIYQVSPGYATGPLAAGRAVDYAYVSGIYMSFQIELRDNGEYGFFLPESEILPTASEAFAALRVFAKELVPPV